MDDTEWISPEAAAEWLVREHGLSVGAAKHAVRDAIRSDNVQMTARLGNLPDPQPISADEVLKFGAVAFLAQDVRVNLADLRWQIGQQLGKPAAPPKPKAPKPSQEQVYRALLDFAKANDVRLKQSDPEAKALLTAMGATTRQIPKAFGKLPARYRYGKGGALPD
jgi:hypothetical protein